MTTLVNIFDHPTDDVEKAPIHWRNGRYESGHKLSITPSNLKHRIIDLLEKEASREGGPKVRVINASGNLCVVFRFLNDEFYTEIMDAGEPDMSFVKIYLTNGMSIHTVKAFSEFLNTIAYRISNNSISTSMVNVISNKLWTCKGPQALAEALETIANSPAYAEHHVLSITRAMSYAGYVLRIEDDLYTGRPCVFVETKEEYYLRVAEDHQRLAGILGTMANEIAEVVVKRGYK